MSLESLGSGNVPNAGLRSAGPPDDVASDAELHALTRLEEFGERRRVLLSHNLSLQWPLPHVGLGPVLPSSEREALPRAILARMLVASGAMATATATPMVAEGEGSGAGAGGGAGGGGNKVSKPSPSLGYASRLPHARTSTRVTQSGPDVCAY